ncbi:MAG: hypothetical protein Q9181_003947 [Wetmoreana brouardii]
MARRVKRYIDKNTRKVAILISLGYGAGWSSWAPAVLNGNHEEAARIAAAKIPGFYTNGAKQLKVKWVGQGEDFRVGECDGYESLIFRSDVKYLRA